MDGTTNPAIEQVLDGFDDPRLRVVRHDGNRGIAAAYNTFVSEGRGELIAMLGDDDVSLPGRIRRQVEIFDRFPDTGVVHGDATVIDATAAAPGAGECRFHLARAHPDMWRSHNHIVDPTRMVHRRVYETVGGYDDRYPLANDMDFWLRAAERFRFRHRARASPLVAVRRHGDNSSGQEHRAREIADVERALEASLERTGAARARTRARLAGPRARRGRASGAAAAGRRRHPPAASASRTAVSALRAARRRDRRRPLPRRPTRGRACS